MEPLTLADDGRHVKDDGYDYVLSRVPDEVDALGLARLLGVEREGIEVTYAGGTAVLSVAGLTEESQRLFERELADILIEVNAAHAVADRILRSEDAWEDADATRAVDDEAAVRDSFGALK